MNNRNQTRRLAGFCLVSLSVLPVCLRADSPAKNRWVATAANLLTNPPAVDYLIYADTYRGKTTYDRVLYQAGNFVLRTADTFKNLHRPALLPMTSIFGKTGDIYWYFDGKFESILKISDISMLDSTNPAVAQGARGVVQSAKMFGRQGLMVLCLSSKATPLDFVQSSGSEFSFRTLQGATISGTIRPGEGTNEVKLDFVSTLAGKQRFEKIVCHFNPDRFKGAFPYLIERYVRFSESTDFTNVETFKIIAFHPAGWRVSRTRFEPESAFLPGVVGVWYYKTNQASFRIFDPKADMRVEAFGRILRPSTLRHIYFFIYALSTISIVGISLLIFRHRQAVNQGKIR